MDIILTPQAGFVFRSHQKSKRAASLPEFVHSTVHVTYPQFA
jgi:hypothetical protein